MNFNMALHRAPDELPTFLILHCSVNEDPMSGISRKLQTGQLLAHTVYLHLDCVHFRSRGST